MWYKDPNLNVEEDIRLLDSRYKHWNKIVEGNINDKGGLLLLKWELYMKYNQ